MNDLVFSPSLSGTAWMSAIAGIAACCATTPILNPATIMLLAMPDDWPAYIPIGELWRYGGPRRTTAYKLLREGRLHGFKAPWGTMISSESLRALLAEQPERGLHPLLAELRDVL